MILLIFGSMVDLAMNIFECLSKFLVFWHPWHPWVCVRSDLKQICAIPPTLQQWNWKPLQKKHRYLLNYIPVLFALTSSSFSPFHNFAKLRRLTINFESSYFTPIHGKERDISGMNEHDLTLMYVVWKGVLLSLCLCVNFL